MGQSDQEKFVKLLNEMECNLKKIKDEYFNTENFDEIDWGTIGVLSQKIAVTAVTTHSESFKNVLWPEIKREMLE